MDLRGETVLNIRFLDVTEKGDILFLQKNLQVLRYISDVSPCADVDFRLVLQKFYFYAISVT